jgi:hypothetical protein
MNPLTLLTVGPMMIRAIGKMFGGKTEEVAGNVADVVDSVRGLDKPTAQAKIKEALQALPPEALIELKKIEVHIAEIERDREANRLKADSDQFAEANETIREEYRRGDEYIRRTRPRMGRISMNAGIGYILAAEILSRLAKLGGVEISGADVAVAGTLLGPAGFYMTMRTVDAFSPKGKG